ncbi:hypothetical protein ACFPRL_14415 [Pseudoclavibacter helvolus]
MLSSRRRGREGCKRSLSGPLSVVFRGLVLGGLRRTRSIRRMMRRRGDRIAGSGT